MGKLFSTGNWNVHEIMQMDPVKFIVNVLTYTVQYFDCHYNGNLKTKKKNNTNVKIKIIFLGRRFVL